MADANPYRAPREVGDLPFVPGAVRGVEFDSFVLVGWPLVFGANMIVPLLFGWSMTEGRARVGMALAAAVLLASGWGLCYLRPDWARRLIAGSVLIAFSQFFPILQIIAGITAIDVAERMDLVTQGHNFQGPVLATLVGGFLVTFLVGSMILACAAAVALLLGWLARVW